MCVYSVLLRGGSEWWLILLTLPPSSGACLHHCLLPCIPSPILSFFSILYLRESLRLSTYQPATGTGGQTDRPWPFGGRHGLHTEPSPSLSLLCIVPLPVYHMLAFSCLPAALAAAHTLQLFFSTTFFCFCPFALPAFVACAVVPLLPYMPRQHAWCVAVMHALWNRTRQTVEKTLHGMKKA